jgi:hypothetical protein
MEYDRENPFQSLARDARPPSRLKARLVRTLRDRGMLAPLPRPRLVLAATIVAVAALAIAMLLFRSAGPSASPTFVLLLYEDESFTPSRTEGELVAEYGAWAADLERGGALVLGEPLTRASFVLHGAAPGTAVESVQPRSDLGALAGLFVIRARDQAAALAIARTCPHLRYGGRVVVRPVAG